MWLANLASLPRLADFCALKHSSCCSTDGGGEGFWWEQERERQDGQGKRKRERSRHGKGESLFANFFTGPTPSSRHIITVCKIRESSRGKAHLNHVSKRGKRREGVLANMDVGRREQGLGCAAFMRQKGVGHCSKSRVLGGRQGGVQEGHQQLGREVLDKVVEGRGGVDLDAGVVRVACRAHEGGIDLLVEVVLKEWLWKL